MSFAGKQAVVTGGAGAIGSAIVRGLLTSGARVFCLDLPGSATPQGAEALDCDLGDPRARALAIETLSSLSGGRLDLLVHCAGITRDALLWKMELEDWERVIEVNLSAAFSLLRGCVPLMRAQGPGGAVVLISSINGERGKVGQANYAASKAGLLGLGKTAARELGHFGLRVNCVCPGFIETEMTARLSAELHERARDESALKRLGAPTDVAEAVLFLCSERSRHITGQVLRVDGGQLIA